MERLVIYIATLAILSISLYPSTASATGHHGVDHVGLAAHVSPHAPAQHSHCIEGRVTAVMRMSREITVRTPKGEVHQIKVPNGAHITSQEGNHFSGVRSGEHVRVTAVHDQSRGLVAKTLSVP
jgi:hypothetical protein